MMMVMIIVNQVTKEDEGTRIFLEVREEHYRTVFWQMTDMEYLYGLRGIRCGVLSIEYSYSTSLQ